MGLQRAGHNWSDWAHMHTQAYVSFKCFSRIKISLLATFVNIPSLWITPRRLTSFMWGRWRDSHNAVAINRKMTGSCLCCLLHLFSWPVTEPINTELAYDSYSEVSWWVLGEIQIWEANIHIRGKKLLSFNHKHNVCQTSGTKFLLTCMCLC